MLAPPFGIQLLAVILPHDPLLGTINLKPFAIFLVDDLEGDAVTIAQFKVKLSLASGFVGAIKQKA